MAFLIGPSWRPIHILARRIIFSAPRGVSTARGKRRVEVEAGQTEAVKDFELDDVLEVTRVVGDQGQRYQGARGLFFRI